MVYPSPYTRMFVSCGSETLYVFWSILCVWLYTAVAPPLNAQSYLTHSFSREEGLVQSQVQTVYQDRKGYLWFGTWGGISRFDGLEFKNYTLYDGLSSINVSGFAEDHEGQLWASTSNGINVITDTSLVTLTTDDGLINNHVHALLGLPSGDIWIASASGLTLYDKSGFSHITTVDGLPSNDVLSMTLDQAGTLWIGTSEGICAMKTSGPDCYAGEGNLPHPAVRDLLVDQRGRVWAGTDQGIGMLLPGNGSRRFIALDYLPQMSVNALLEDRYGAIWIGALTGIYRIGIDTQITHQWVDQVWRTSSLLLDREGSVWAGTLGQGAIQFQTSAFEYLNPSLNLLEDAYLALHRDSSGVMWAGTANNGMYRIEQDTVYHFNPGATPLLNHIRSIAHDPNGTLWVGTKKGVVRYDGQMFKQYIPRKNALEAYTYQVLPTRSGDVWVASIGGLSVIRKDSLEQVPLPSASNRYIVHALLETDDRLWIATDQGLAYYKDNVFRYIESLRPFPVSTITPDDTGDFWLGTMGYGVFRFDPDTESIRDTLHAADGLNNGTVYFTLLDAGGDLWIGTDVGVNHLDMLSYRETGDTRIRGYSKRDGIYGVETNKHVAALSPDGALWFGTLKGLIKHDAAAQSTNVIPAPVHISHVSLFNTRIPHTVTTSDTTPLHLSHQQNYLTFEYRGLSFIAPEYVTYSHRLEGFENTWSSPTKNRFVSYSNLPPGSYAFRVRARNSDGIWSTQPAAFSFVIAPPFWQTPWFLLSSLTLFLMILFAIVQLRTRALQQQHRMLERMVAQRTQELEETHHALLDTREEALQAARARSAFLSTMTHELRTPMNGIIGMAQLLTFTNLDEEQANYSGTVLEISQSMLEMIENLLTFADLSAGQRVVNNEVFNLEALLRESMKSIESQARSKGLETDYFRATPIPGYITSDAEHIRQVIKHLLSNAVKFTQEGLVCLEAAITRAPADDPSAARLRLSIHDTGIGIAADQLDRIFDSFTQLDMSATRSFDGTGIGLTLASRMTTLLQGTLTATSTLQAGSTFHVEIPVTLDKRPYLPSRNNSPLIGKKAWIIVISPRENRRLTLLCRSLGMIPETAQPAALFSAIPDTDTVLTDTRLESDHVQWNDTEAPAYTTTPSLKGIVVDPTMHRHDIEQLLRLTFVQEPTT